MKKYFISGLIYLLGIMVHAQANQSWKGYFSYNEIKDVAQSPTVFFAASENALFSRNLATNQQKTINTIDGLSGQTITALYHSATFNKTMVGYDNGLVIIINEADGSKLNVVDIINKQLPPNIKKVNHFMESNGVVYISCDFGIVQYNLATLGFGDTYFIGDGGDEIVVSQTAVYDGFIYAATENGIRRASVTNPNLVDYSQWITMETGQWAGIESFGAELIAVNSTGYLYRWNGAAFVAYLPLPLPAVDIRSAGDYLVVSTASRVYVYNQSLGFVAQVDSSVMPVASAQITCATVIGDNIFIGTRENGVLETSVSNPSTFVFISPDGPQRNNIFSITKSPSNLWAVYGDYTFDYNPDPLHYYGISKLNADGWLNIPYSEVHEIGKEAPDLVRATVDPNDENHVFVSSYHAGLLEFQNDALVAQYDQTNSGLESLLDPSAPTYTSVRVEQGVFDKQGNYWLTNGLIQDPLKVLTPSGNWQSFNLQNILNNFFSTRFGRMVIDKNGTKWMCTSQDGLVAFNENGNIAKKISSGSEGGNLPVEDVRAVAIDNNNQLWIGTRGGLRVLSSVDRFLTDSQMTAFPIIILEEGVAQELLYEQFITDIVVDGANNKWVGTADSGVFLLSPNGQETLRRFTSSNSPLPSNTINDIDINSVTGEVFFATDKGMVSFKGTATGASNNLNNVYVYPNPVRPEFAGTVKISGLVDKANVKIADIGGNLVFETIAEGGTIEWDTTAFGKYRVASGVYMIFISSEDGSETKVKKVMVVR
ncbi:MAG: T9SS type A sorting domain-containing protein [Flavobacterium sp.]|nr:MAG: T9SS type A sorting domain-containing protein [Flavobacterium sp.]